MADGEQNAREKESGNKEDKVPRATLEQKLQIIDDFHTLKRPQLDIVNKYRYTVSILTSSFSEWLKHEQELRDRFNLAGYPSQRRSRRRAKFKYEKINHAMDMMVKQRLDNNEPISEPILRGYWSIFAHQYGVDDPKRLVGFSHGWLAQFKQRHGLNRKRMNGSSYVYEKDPSGQSQQDEPEGEMESDRPEIGVAEIDAEINLSTASSLSPQREVNPTAPQLPRMNSSTNLDSHMDLKKPESGQLGYDNIFRANVGDREPQTDSRRIPSRASSRDRLSPRKEPIAEQIKRKNNFELLQPQATEVLKADVTISASLLPANSAYGDSERNNFSHLLHAANSVQELSTRSTSSLPPPPRPLSTQSASRNQFKPQLGLSFSSSSSNFHQSKSLTSLQRLGPPKQPLAHPHSTHSQHSHRHNHHTHQHSRHQPEQNSLSRAGTSVNEFALENYRQQVYAQNIGSEGNTEKISTEVVPIVESRTSNTTVGNTSTNSIAFLLGDSAEAVNEQGSLKRSRSPANSAYHFPNDNSQSNLKRLHENESKRPTPNESIKSDSNPSVISANEVERFIFVFADRFFLDYQYDYPQTMKLFQEFKNSFLNERIILERAQRDSSNKSDNSTMRPAHAPASRYFEALPQVKRVKGSHGSRTHPQLHLNLDSNVDQNTAQNEQHYSSSNLRMKLHDRQVPSYSLSTEGEIGSKSDEHVRRKIAESRNIYQYRQSGNIVNSGQLEDYILPASPTGSNMGINKNKLFLSALNDQSPGPMDQESANAGLGSGSSLVPINLNSNVSALNAASQSPASTPNIANITTTPSFLRFFDSGTPGGQSPPMTNMLNPILSPVTTTPTTTEGKFIGLGGGAIPSPTTSLLPPPIRSYSSQNPGNYANSGIMRLLDASALGKR